MRRKQDPGWTPKGEGVFTSDEYDSEDDAAVNKEPKLPQATPRKVGTNEASKSATPVASSPPRTRATFTKPLASSRKVDLHKLHYEARNGNCNIKIEEYTGPIRTENIPGQGHRIVATQDAPKGTLLLVSKAIAAVNNTDDSDDADAFHRLTLALMWKVRRHPQKLCEIYELASESQYGGARFPEKPDYKRIRAICKQSAMSPEVDFDAVPLNYLLDDVSDDTSRGPTSLWVIPSCFRHSCLGTAYMAFYGDVAVVHTLVDIKRGEEVTIVRDGVHPFDSYRERKSRIKATMRRGGISCTCRLCEFERNDLMERKRSGLLLSVDEFMRLAKNYPRCVPTAVEAITNIVQEIRATYSNQNVLRTQLYEPLKSLGHLYEWNGDYRKAIDCFKELISCLHESHLPVYGVRRCLQIARCHRNLGEDAMARVWALKAIELHRIRTGSTDGLFKKIFPDFADLI